MTVNDLMERMSYLDGRRILKVATAKELGSYVSDVVEDDAGEDDGEKTVTIFAESAPVSVKELLDAWAQNKQPIDVPGYVQTYMTTMQIIDELEEMMDVQKPLLISYLANAGYQIANRPDGPHWRLFVRMT